ncbi:MAG: DNA-directed RNA polymerase subunit beta' [Candidatus Muiribacteriota bacterium]
MWDIEKFNAIKISVASPDDVQKWTYGEVKNPETINYRTHKPEKDGLFCEKIFGPTKDYQCTCGKYKSIRYKGIICERCGVEITRAKVRRERMGSIELAAPVAHIWFSKGTPNYMAVLLDISPRDLEKVLYFNSYIVLDPGKLPLAKKQLLTEVEYREYHDKYKDIFRAGMGAEAIKELFSELNLDHLIGELQNKLSTETSAQKKNIIKRLEIAKMFKDSKNRPEWMILDTLPVIPPDLRPMVQLDGGRFATSDLNDLYRRVINRNNRLKKLLSIDAPDIIIKNEKRMLQEAVNALIDNGKHGKAIVSSGKRPLKSLNDMLKGKQGRFRQNLLGKRVDYSGRSVIVVGPKLKLHQCGLPKDMALELFKPFIMHKLVAKGKAFNIKSAKKIIENKSDEVWDVLEEVISNQPVILNRAPTLHRLGIQAFEPVLVEGKAIRIHPLVCSAFNADFDGDQMAVHVPLLAEAQAEAKLLLMSTGNIIAPSSGKPITVPTHDMTIGTYYLTWEVESNDYVTVKEDSNGKVAEKLRTILNPVKTFQVVKDPKTGEEVADSLEKITPELIDKIEKIKLKELKVLKYQVFANCEEAVMAYESGKVELKTKVFLYYEGEMIETTIGRIIFNVMLPKELRFVNKQINKGVLSKLISRAYNTIGQTETALMLDRMKELGFKFATRSGVSISISECLVPPRKQDVLNKAKNKVENFNKRYNNKQMTYDEKRQATIDVWMNADQELNDDLQNSFSKQVNAGIFNSVYMMAISGARGSFQQMKQLAAMRGLMSNPQGDIMDFPITSNFREGLSVTEYFISTFGARKGIVDTALRTADSGYLTRKLADVAQEVVVKEYDCETEEGLLVFPLRKKRTASNNMIDEIIVPISQRLEGRVLAKDIIHPKTKDVLFTRNTIVEPEMAKQIEKTEVELPINENLIGLATAEQVVDLKNNKIIISPDKVIDEFVVQKLKEAKIPEIKVKPLVYLRSALTCKVKNGSCALCYGKDLSLNRLVSVGEAVGIVAAQSIGEPGTQLTMRTFHTGGIAEAQRVVVTSKNDGIVNFDHLSWTRKSERNIVGENTFIDNEDNKEVDDVKRIALRGYLTIKTNDGKSHKYYLPSGSVLKVEEDDHIAVGDVLVEYDPGKLVASISGKAIFESLDVKDNVVVSEKGRLIIKNKDVKEVYFIEQGSYLTISEGDEVQEGDILAETVSDQGAAISGVDGVVDFFDIKVKNQKVISSGGIIFIAPDTGYKTVDYKLPKNVKEYITGTVSTSGAQLKVVNGANIKSGDKLLEITSEIDGKIKYKEGASNITVKKDTKREYHISKDMPLKFDEKKKEVGFVSDVSGKVTIAPTKTTSSKFTENVRRILITREEEHEIPKFIKFPIDKVVAKPGEHIEKDKKITKPIRLQPSIEGIVERSKDNKFNVVRVKNIKNLKLNQKSILADKIKGKEVYEDIYDNEGKLVLEKGSRINDDFLKRELLVAIEEGTVEVQDFKLVDVREKSGLEYAKNKPLYSKIIVNKKELGRKGDIIEKKLLENIQKNAEKIKQIKIDVPSIKIQSKVEFSVNRKEQFKNRITNRKLIEPVINTKTGECIAEKGQEISEDIAERIEKEKLNIKNLKFFEEREYNVPYGAAPKVKSGAASKVGQELIMPTHLDSIVIVSEEEFHYIPENVEILVEDGEKVKTDTDIIKPLPALISGIEGKVNYITEYDQETGLELVKKISIFAGKEFVIPFGFNLKVSKDDFVEKNQEITDFIPYVSKKEKKDETVITSVEKMEKKYKVSEDIDILVKNGQEVSAGDVIAILKNNKIKLIEEVEEKLILDSNDVYVTNYHPVYEGSETIKSDGKKLKKDKDYKINYNNGEVKILKKVGDAKNLISYKYEKESVVRLIHSYTKKGKRRNVVEAIRVQSGEAHQIFEGANLNVDCNTVDLNKKNSIIHRISGKIALNELKDKKDKVIVKEGEKITKKLAEFINKNKSEIKDRYFKVSDKVKKGTILARFEQTGRKTLDIVQGLPRVTEVLEIRKPKKEAIMVHEDGVVRASGANFFIENSIGEKKQTKAQLGSASIMLSDGEIVQTGDFISEGSISPKKVLKVAGLNPTQRYLVDEVQQIYREQGVNINDKHIEIIVSQMSKKVKIKTPGDTRFMAGEVITVTDLEEENEKVIKRGGQPAEGNRIIQGITKAALTTDSFISAASFQETTRVLTKAAIEGKVDRLKGLKENLIIGKLIPCGTGLRKFNNLKVTHKDEKREVEEAEVTQSE